MGSSGGPATPGMSLPTYPCQARVLGRSSLTGGSSAFCSGRMHGNTITSGSTPSARIATPEESSISTESDGSISARPRRRLHLDLLVGQPGGWFRTPAAAISPSGDWVPIESEKGWVLPCPHQVLRTRTSPARAPPIGAHPCEIGSAWVNTVPFRNAPQPSMNPRLTRIQAFTAREN